MDWYPKAPLTAFQACRNCFFGEKFPGNNMPFLRKVRWIRWFRDPYWLYDFEIHHDYWCISLSCVWLIWILIWILPIYIYTYIYIHIYILPIACCLFPIADSLLAVAYWLGFALLSAPSKAIRWCPASEQGNAADELLLEAFHMYPSRFCVLENRQ